VFQKVAPYTSAASIVWNSSLACSIADHNGEAGITILAKALKYLPKLVI